MNPEQEVYVVHVPYGIYCLATCFTQKEHAEKWAKFNRGIVDGPISVYTQDICPPQDSEELKKAKILHKLSFFLSREEIDELLGLQFPQPTNK